MVSVTGTQTTTITLTADEEIVLVGGNAQMVVNGPAVFTNGFDEHQIIVSGDITTYGPAIMLQNSDQNYISIGVNATVDASVHPEFTGAQGAAIYLDGNFQTVLNNGGITGYNGIFLENTASNYIANNGEIAAQFYGIRGQARTEISNTGSIIGDRAIQVGNGSEIHNSGDIVGGYIGIETLSYNEGTSAVSLENSGTISATIGIASGVSLTALNSGTISGEESGMWSNDSLSLVNSGSIFHNASGNFYGYAVAALGGDLEVSNSGDILSQSDIFNVGGSDPVVARIENSGTLQAGLDFLTTDRSQVEEVVLENSGSIQAQRIGASIGDLSLLNSGQIELYDYQATAFYTDRLSVLNTGSMLLLSSSEEYEATAFSALSGRNVLRNEGSIITDGTLINNFGSGILIVENSGRMKADYGVYTTGTSSRLSNSGDMQTVNTTAYFNADDTRVINQGTMSSSNGEVISLSSSGGHHIVNSGDMSGLTYAVYGNFLSSASTLKNSGTLHSSGDIAVTLANSLVFSGGTLSQSDAHGHKLVNSGDILGNVSLSAGGDTVINSGQILGDVSLGGGDNTYNGRGGFVSGSITGGSGIDIVTGGEVADVIDAGDGANEIRSLGGDDTITTGDGVDLIIAGAGDDEIISGGGDDTIRGGDGEDDINGQGGVDFIQGGGGNDYIRMGNGDGQRGEGNAGDDYIAGGNQKDVLLGGADEDELLGQGGNDVLRGGTGDDVLEGGTGDDRIIGNAGEDTAVFSGALADYTFTLNGNGTVDVADTVGTDGTDNLFGVELVEFSDGTYLLSDFV